MTQQLHIHETKTQLSKLIELTQAGEEFVCTITKSLALFISNTLIFNT